ncbi:MAG: hypothetical protein JW982_11285 [Spirochaetes bacterium]|nr:hypothetical protein [Spirochaetota bacterium]
MKIVIIEDDRRMQTKVVSYVTGVLNYEFVRICRSDSDIDDTIIKYNPDLIFISSEKRLNSGVCSSCCILRYESEDVFRSLQSEISWLLYSGSFRCLNICSH